MTYLRHPVDRFVSEWLHVSRGTTWYKAKTICDKTFPLHRNISKCHKGSDWAKVGLQEFIDCPHNPAINRQTWMLADLFEISCDRFRAPPDEPLKKQILQSAKRNLRNMFYFGFTELRNETSALLQKEFGLNYKKSKLSAKTDAMRAAPYIGKSLELKIHQINDLDMELYAYARELYNQRYHR